LEGARVFLGLGRPVEVRDLRDFGGDRDRRGFERGQIVSLRMGDVPERIDRDRGDRVRVDEAHGLSERRVLESDIGLEVRIGLSQEIDRRLDRSRGAEWKFSGRLERLHLIGKYLHRLLIGLKLRIDRVIAPEIDGEAFHRLHGVELHGEFRQDFGLIEVSRLLGLKPTIGKQERSQIPDRSRAREKPRKLRESENGVDVEMRKKIEVSDSRGELGLQDLLNFGLVLEAFVGGKIAKLGRSVGLRRLKLRKLVVCRANQTQTQGASGYRSVVDGKAAFGGAKLESRARLLARKAIARLIESADESDQSGKTRLKLTRAGLSDRALNGSRSGLIDLVAGEPDLRRRAALGDHACHECRRAIQRPAVVASELLGKLG